MPAIDMKAKRSSAVFNKLLNAKSTKNAKIMLLLRITGLCLLVMAAPILWFAGNFLVMTILGIKSST